MDSTIEKSEKSTGGVYYNERTADMLQEIRDEIEGKSAEEIRKMLSKEELAVAEEIRAINDELTPKAEYVAGVLRGVPFRPFSQYFHRIVLKGDDSKGLKNVDALINDAKTRMRKPSTKAQNIQARITAAPPAVNFDPFASAKRGARYILTDYHMTEAVRTNARLMNKLKNTGMDRKQKRFLNVIDKASETTVTDALVQSYTISNWVEEALEMAKKQGYRVVLADVPRMTGELLSNLLYAAVAAPRVFANGIGKYYTVANTKGADILSNVGSVQTTRLYADTDTVSSRMMDTVRAVSGPERGDVSRAVNNRIRQMWALTGSRVSGAVGKLADTMITTPDKAITRPIWFGSFAAEFENQTGQEVDFDKIAANDEAYMAENAEAIQAATDKADLESVRSGATDNPFLGIVNSMRKEGEGPARAIFRAANNYMTRFLVFEWVTFRTGLNALVSSGAVSRGEGIRLMSAVASRMVAYVFITKQLRDLLDDLLIPQDDEDEFDNTLEEDLMEAIENAMASMVLGGTYGSLVRGAGASAYEFWRMSQYEDMGLDYTYDDQVLIPLINPLSANQPYKATVQTVIRMSGPYNPQLRALDVLFRSITSGEKKTDEALVRKSDERLRARLEFLGLAGMIPLYKDIRRLFLKEIYKDLDKDDTPESMEQRIAEELKKMQQEARREQRKKAR